MNIKSFLISNSLGETVSAMALKKMNDDLKKRLLDLCMDVAGSREIVAACMYGPRVQGYGDEGSYIEVLLVLKSSRHIFRCHLKRVTADGEVFILVVDQGFFEKDVESEWLGGLVVDNILTPYEPLVNGEYLQREEIEVKRRIILEIVSNLVLEYPEMSSEILLKPEYFLYEAMRRRALLFPLITYKFLNVLRDDLRERNLKLMLNGFRKALETLVGEGVLEHSDGFFKISREYIRTLKRRKILFVNIFGSIRRRIIRYIFTAFPKIRRSLMMEKELYIGLLREARNLSAPTIGGLTRLSEPFLALSPPVPSLEEDMIDEYLERYISEAPLEKLEDPEKYIFISTPLGLVSLSDRITVEDFLRRVIPSDEPYSALFRKLGGILNSVYVLDIRRGGREERIVVKVFKDWYGLKWFPLILWALGTKGFSMLGRSRLEREYAINRFLSANGIYVPNILYVSPKERMIFEEFVEGPNLTEVVRNIVLSKGSALDLMDLLRRVGAELAKVHGLGVALGDCKPENVLVAPGGRICFVDLEQASKGGDQAWDIAEFLYYTGHYVPLFLVDVVKEMSRCFLEGYLEGGGKLENIRRARSIRYMKVFSFFTPLNIILAIREVCGEILNTWSSL